MNTPKFDDDFSKLPTRKGTPQGHGIERKMIFEADGTEGFRTIIRNNPDGTTTMLRTRGGWPEFTTSTPKVVTVGSMLVYLESGVLSALTDNDTPSNWSGLDIVANPNFHKWVEATTDKLGDYSAGPLYPSPSSAMVAASKKNLALKIPASVYSGKMRLFMQAQYGSVEATGYSLIERGPAERGGIAGVGSLAVCKYQNRMASTYEAVDDFRPNVFSVQYLDTELGFMADNSCGVFTSGGLYWLISIVRSSTAFTVKAYPLEPDEKVAEFATRLTTLYSNPDQSVVRKSIAQCEAYLFAYCAPNLSGELNLGTFDLGDNGLGDPIAYGWHFNSLGSEAKMVIHHLTPNTLTHMRWSSRTLTMSLAFAADSGPITAGNFTCSITAQNKGGWANPNGVLLYAPCFEGYDDTVEYPTRLHITSLASQVFSGDEDTIGEILDIPVYGFYSNNAWKPLTISRKNGLDQYHIEINSTGCMSYLYGDLGSIDVLTTDYDQFYHAGMEALAPFQSYTDSESAGSFSHYRTALTFGVNYGLKFDGQSVSGEQPVDTGSPAPLDRSDKKWSSITAVTQVSASSIGGYANYGHFPFNTNPAEWPPITSRNSALISTVSSWQASVVEEAAGLSSGVSLSGTLTYEITAALSIASENTNFYREISGDAVSAVIPCGDSEAIFVLQGRSDNWVQYHHSIGTTIVPSRVKVTGHKNYVDHNPPGSSWTVDDSVVSDTAFDRQNIFPTGANDSALQPTLPDTASSRYITRQGVKFCPRKPDPLPFWSPQTAYFDDGMYSMTSVLDHYNCSEGLRSDSGMDVKQRFCGWI